MKALKIYQLDNNLTQKELAEKIGCSMSMINKLLNKKNGDISVSLMRKINAATQIPYELLINLD